MEVRTIKTLQSLYFHLSTSIDVLGSFSITEPIKKFTTTSQEQADQAQHLSTSSEGINELSNKLLKLAEDLYE